MKVLIAEDNHISRMVVKKYLEGMGYDVLEATDGYEGERIWEREQPDILISDWNMPGLNGIDLVRHIRANEVMYYTYIIIATERENINDLKEAFDAGADDFLRKPLHRQELKLRLRAGERLLTLQSKDQLVYALAKLAEIRDNETGEHLERIRLYSRVLTHKMMHLEMYTSEINPTFVKHIYETSPLHDIGKIGIPDEILKKKGRYTSEEKELMKEHTLIGKQALQEVAKNGLRPYLKMAIEIAGSHHEWWDGSGYPEGLTKEEIPLSARIIAVADVYDALRSKRVYKSDMPHQTVVMEILHLSGTQFDPLIVQAFIACEKQFEEISEVNERVYKWQKE